MHNKILSFAISNPHSHIAIVDAERYETIAHFAIAQSQLSVFIKKTSHSERKLYLTNGTVISFVSAPSYERLRGLPMSELHYVEEMKPFTEADWKKCTEAYSHRWLSERYGMWLAETEQERKLRELAETYHTGCEAYDRRVCSGTSPRTGEAMPMTVDEMRLINNHALRMREDMVEEGERFGFTRKQVEEAIRKYSR